ncbi:DNA-directed RNA polymerase subunit alpha C-terminal domain-containing protein [Crinalium epipsammum]|uniref:DNA-directed RNA polymerase subunit alpha C-terminal domain-containing protein n=1 Tax=Crinalium epipsammum TaxID=241425 RepID=UPI0002FDC567|nr:DNA-directed RNA polymerase subunit alpha C-terminal domain-containing protein [Crinalium epipsammum]
MSEFEQLIKVVGRERMIKLLQEVAKEAIDSGDWLKVRQVTDIVAQINGHPASVTEENKPNVDNSQLELVTINISQRCLELLNKAGIFTINDLQGYSLDSLLEINGIGEMAAKQIDKALQTLGITLHSFGLRSRWQSEQSSINDDQLSINNDPN